jgi:hypothetical protein
MIARFVAGPIVRGVACESASASATAGSLPFAGLSNTRIFSRGISSAIASAYIDATSRVAPARSLVPWGWLVEAS